MTIEESALEWDQPARATLSSWPSTRRHHLPAVRLPALFAPRTDLGIRAALLGSVQRLAGNRAATAIAHPTVQLSPGGGRCDSCAEAEEEAAAGTEEREAATPVQRLGLGFLGDLVGDLLGGLAGPGDAQGLDAKAAAACTEQPTINDASNVPVTINADSAVEFVQKMAAQLGNAHMAPSFGWKPEVDDKDRITKINFTLTTKIVRPRFGNGRLATGGRDPEKERALIKQTEALIEAHEKRHRAIAQEYAQKAVCAVIGKPGAGYEAILYKVMCDMNKAQEALDGREGMLAFTKDRDRHDRRQRVADRDEGQLSLRRAAEADQVAVASQTADVAAARCPGNQRTGPKDASPPSRQHRRCSTCSPPRGTRRWPPCCSEHPSCNASPSPTTPSSTPPSAAATMPRQWRTWPGWPVRRRWPSRSRG